MTAQLAAAGLADVHFPVGQAREHGKTGVEGGTFGQNNRLRLRRQRIGVHGVNKDSGGRAPRERRFAERSGTQRRPLARRQQLLLYGVARQFGQRVRGVTGKRHRVIALDINHHRLQHAPFAAVDRADDPARRGGKADAEDLFIFEQDLTFLTRSPSLTAIAGRMPTYSSPSSATRFTAGAGEICCNGMPAMGKSSPFVILIISLAGIRNLNPDAGQGQLIDRMAEKKGRNGASSTQDGREASFLTLMMNRRKCNIS